MEISKKQRHAVEAVVQIACHTGVEPLSSRALAEAQDLKPRYLEQILQQLVREGLLKGMRGPKGGYVLAREKRRICLADIICALQDEAEESSHSQLGQRVLDPVWQKARQAALQQLEQVQLAELCSAVSVAVQSVAKAGQKQRADFVI